MDKDINRMFARLLTWLIKRCSPLHLHPRPVQTCAKLGLPLVCRWPVPVPNIRQCVQNSIQKFFSQYLVDVDGKQARRTGTSSALGSAPICRHIQIL